MCGVENAVPCAYEGGCIISWGSWDTQQISIYTESVQRSTTIGKAAALERLVKFHKETKFFLQFLHPPCPSNSLNS